MKKLPAFFYTDKYSTGVLLALFIPIVAAIPVFPFLNLLKSLGWVSVHLPISKYILLSCIPNLIVFRQYYKSLLLEKTAKGMLVVTLVEVVVLILLSNRSIF